MILGISYDKWHAILALFVTVVVFIIVMSFFSESYPAATTLKAFILSALIVSYLQAMNEAIQAIDKNLIKKYKTWKNFQKNSRIDWKYTFIGWSIGTFVGFAYAIWFFK